MMLPFLSTWRRSKINNSLFSLASYSGKPFVLTMKLAVYRLCFPALMTVRAWFGRLLLLFRRFA